MKLTLAIWRLPTAVLAGGLVSALAFPLAGGSSGRLWLPAASELLAWVGLVPLVLALENERPRRAFLWGWLAGVVFFTVCLYWLAGAVSTFGRMPLAAALLVLLALVVFLALFWGAAFAVAALAQRRLGWSVLWTLPIFWSALEFVRNWVFTGFPWASLGSSQARTLYLAQLAWLGGPYLVAFSVVWINCSLAAVWRYCRLRARPPWYAAVAPLLMLIAAILALVRLRQDFQSERSLPVGIVQGNLDEKAMQWRPLSQASVLERMALRSREGNALGARLLVWPEGTLPQPLAVEAERFALGFKEAELLTGAILEKYRDGRRWIFNSALLVDPEANIRGRYDKVHLVPFGEYVPLGKYLPLRWFVPSVVTFFTAGISHQPLQAQAGKLGLLICYESIFPQIARATVARGAEVLINITNDSWFGPTSAPWQHLAQSRMRAIETGRFLVRAANTGPSALIDPAGRVLEQLPLGLSDSPVEEKMPPPWLLPGKVFLLNGHTPYTVLGDWFAWGCALASIALLALAVRRREEQAEQAPIIPRRRKPPERKDRSVQDGRFKST